MKKEKKDLLDAATTEKELSASLLRLSKTNFSEVFACWTHIKAIRVFVESVLRYGLPPNCQEMIIKVKPKHEKKARDLLNSHFANLGGGGKLTKVSGEEALEENLAVLIGEKDYAPFVFFPIPIPQ